MGLKKCEVLASCLVLWLLPAFGVKASNLERNNTRLQNSPFVLPIVKRDSLLNGLQLMTIEQPSAETVSIHLRINSGALFDLAGKGGLADITAGMLLKGGGGLNAKAVTDTVEQSGLTINITTGWDSTNIVTSGPADTLDTLFDLLGKLVITPAFDQKELDSLKASRAAAMGNELRNDAVAVHRKALEACYGSFPFGRPARGTAESIGQIQRQDLVYFHSRFYLANNSALVVSGNATAEQVTRLARSKLGAWKKGEKVPATFKPAEAQAARRIFILDRSEDQSVRAAIAQIGLSRRADDYLAAMVMSDVLNKHASKLASVHAKTTIEADIDARLLAGPLFVHISSTPDDLPGDLTVVLDTMSTLISGAPTNESVEAAKAALIAAMGAQLRTPAGTADILLDIETYGLGRDYVVNFANRVNAISPVDVQRAARNYLKPQSVSIAVAGPAARLESSMKKLGTVVVLK